MVANPFSRGLASPARPAPVRPRPKPFDPVRRRPLPRVEPLRPAPVRPSGPLFPPTRPIGRPFGKLPPVPAVPIAPISRYMLLRLGLKALPWLNLMLTAYDLYLLYQAWNKPGDGVTFCRNQTYPEEYWYWVPHQHCYSDSPSTATDSLRKQWSVGNPVLRHSENVENILARPLEWYGPYSENPGFPEMPITGEPLPVSAPVPPLEIPFPYPFSPTPSPNIEFPPSRPADEKGPGYRPRPDSPVLPDPFLPGVPATEPGPGVQPEPHTPAQPVAPRPRPHPNSPFPEWPFPGISPEVVPGPWPLSPPVPYPLPGRPPVPAPVPSIDLGPSPGVPGVPPYVTPEPGFHTPRPPFREEKERKRRFNGQAAQQWMDAMNKLGGSYMEYDDFISALYKGIPWKFRRWRGRDGVWRDRDITSASRAQRMWEYMEKYNVKVGIEELAKMYLTDKAIGKFGQKLKERTRDLGDNGLYAGASGLGRGTPLDSRSEEARKKLIREKYQRERKDREYWKYINMGEAGWFRQKRLRPDTEIPWARRETRHVGSSASGQRYNKRGRGGPYYVPFRG